MLMMTRLRRGRHWETLDRAIEPRDWPVMHDIFVAEDVSWPERESCANGVDSDEDSNGRDNNVIETTPYGLHMRSTVELDAARISLKKKEIRSERATGSPAISTTGFLASAFLVSCRDPDKHGTYKSSTPESYYHQ